jgi:AraC-like DNA-binding protein
VITFPRERVFPNGQLEIIIHLGEPYRLVEGEKAEPCATACIGGIQLGPMVVEALPGPNRVLGVRLTPAGAYALLARPLYELNGLTVDLRDVAGRAAGVLAERCHDAGSAEDCLRIAERWVSERVARSPGVDPPIAWTAAQIERRGGAVSIAELRERTGLTRTRLATGFREQIGVAPKLYARILRFQRALALVGEGAASLADVALAAGYYDQPHMNADFRELSGMAPRDFLAAHRYPGSVSLAETAS